MIAALRRLLGIAPVPDPVAGQRWLSQNSNKVMVVHAVETLDSGTVMVSTRGELGSGTGGINPIPDHYATGLRQWRWRIRDERRVLL